MVDTGEQTTKQTGSIYKKNKNTVSITFYLIESKLYLYSA